MENQYGICRVAVSPLRAEASDRAEMVSQLLFGDHVEIIEKTERWWLVQNAYDGYQGWLDFKQLICISADQFEGLSTCDTLAPLRFDNVITLKDGSKQLIVAGSNLPFLKDDFCFLGDEKFQINFKAHRPTQAEFKSAIVSTAHFFLNTPYLWGGRHALGIDCSGFVQMVFKMLNIKLKRDASQQAEEGNLVGFLAESKAGDLAFFDNEEAKITHVGLMLNPNEIIHASGKVRIDPIDDQGIFNRDLGKYTHKLRIIKRFVE